MNSTEFKNEQRVPFTQINNDFLRDPSISLKAKGLLCLLLSYSDTWQLNNQWTIKNHIKEGERSYYATLNELKDAGYVVYTVFKDDKGRICKHQYRYSDSKLIDSKPLLQNASVENSGIKNNKVKNTKDNIISKPGRKKGTKNGEGKTQFAGYVNFGNGVKGVTWTNKSMSLDEVGKTISAYHQNETPTKSNVKFEAQIKQFEEFEKLLNKPKTESVLPTTPNIEG